MLNICFLWRAGTSIRPLPPCFLGSVTLSAADVGWWTRCLTSKGLVHTAKVLMALTRFPLVACSWGFSWAFWYKLLWGLVLFESGLLTWNVEHRGIVSPSWMGSMVLLFNWFFVSSNLILVQCNAIRSRLPNEKYEQILINTMHAQWTGLFWPWTDGANDQYLSAKRVYQRAGHTTIYQRQTCLSESRSHNDISAPNVSIRKPVTQRYISAKRVYQKAGHTIYQRQTCLSESRSHDTSASSVVWLRSLRGDISASNVRIRKFVTRLFQGHRTIISNRGYTISLLHYRRISFLQNQRHYILIDKDSRFSILIHTPCIFILYCDQQKHNYN